MGSFRAGLATVALSPGEQWTSPSRRTCYTPFAAPHPNVPYGPF